MVPGSDVLTVLTPDMFVGILQPVPGGAVPTRTTLATLAAFAFGGPLAGEVIGTNTGTGFINTALVGPVAANIVFNGTGNSAISTPNGGMTVGSDAATNNLHYDIDGANGSNRTFRLRTAGSTRWSWGSTTTPESAPVTTATVATVGSGNTSLPVTTTTGVVPTMQVDVAGVTTTTTVSSAVGTSPVSFTASAAVASGNFVIPVSSTAGILAQEQLLGTNIAGSSVIQIIGGTTGTVTTTTTTNVLQTFVNVAVASLTGIFPGMLVGGSAAIDNDTYVVATIPGTFVNAVSLSKNRLADIPNGTSLTFKAAIVLSMPTSGVVSSGAALTASPAIVISQPTTGTISSGTTLTLYPNTGTALAFNTFNDVGALFQSPIQISRATGIVNFSEGVSIIPPVGLVQAPNSGSGYQPLFNQQSAWTGHVVISGAFAHHNVINTTGDAADLGQAGVHDWFHSYTYGGQGWAGGRVAHAINMQQLAGFPSPGGSGTGINNQRIGLNVSSTAGENAGGTDATDLGAVGGSVYAIALYARLFGPGFPGPGGNYGGATNYGELLPLNLNWGAQAGTSMAVKHGLNMSLLGDDAVKGSVEDSYIQMGMQPGAGGSLNALLLGNTQGSWFLPLASGNIIGTVRGQASTLPMAVNYGFDFRDVAFNTSVLSGPGVNVGVNGNFGALSWATSGNVTTLDTNLIHVTNTTIASSTNNLWLVGDGLYDANNTLRCQWLCTSTDSGNPNIPGNITGVSAVPIGPGYIATGSPPATVSVVDQTGVALAVLNLTWSANPALSLQPSGGTVQVGSGLQAANGSVATVLGSVGPVGSHTTVQEWLAVKMPSGNIRYFPGF